MEILRLKAPRIVKPGDSIPQCFEEALGRGKQELRDRDIVAVASKTVAIAEGRTRNLKDLEPSPQALRLSRRLGLSPQFAQAVVDEADRIYWGVRGALLTIKNGDAAVNAGVDQKNAPRGSLVLWPSNPDRSASRIRKALERRFRKRLGTIIVDSRVTPLRLGTIGLALGISGIRPVLDVRGKKDLYGRTARITFHAIADDIASAAHLVMGERSERTPYAIVRGAPARFDRDNTSPRIPPNECLYMSQLSSKPGL